MHHIFPSSAASHSIFFLFKAFLYPVSMLSQMLADTKRRARLLPENFGAIQTVKAHYKKEHRRHQELVEVQREAQKKMTQLTK